MFLTLILSGVSLSMAPVPAQDGTPAVARTAAHDPDAQVCKYTMTTGTRFRRKTCRTRAQWEAMAENSRQMMQETVNRPQIETRRE